MEDKNMTALFSLFVRTYHHKDKNIKVYDDRYSEIVLEESEYESIKSNLIAGIKFFNPSFNGSDEDAIRWIVNNQIGPTVIGRSAFNKRVLDNEIRLGCKQYILYASGYDTSTLNYNINSFEIDKSEVIKDKLERLKNIENSKVNYIESDLVDNDWVNKLIDKGYDKNIKSHNSLLGITYYLEKVEFSNLIKNISNNISVGSSVLFDYQTHLGSGENKKNEMLADGANQHMKAKYSYQELEKILNDNNLIIYEHLIYDDINDEFFYNYNTLNPKYRLNALNGVEYILAVKK